MPVRSCFVLRPLQISLLGGMLAGLVSGAEPVRTSEPASRILVAFDRAEGISGWGVTTAAVAGAGGAAAVRVDASISVPWPGITITAPEPGWDLRGFQRIALDVGNVGAVGSGPLKIHLRIDEPGGEGGKHSVTRSVELAAGTAGTISMELHESGEPWFRPIGMNRVPDAYRGDGEGGTGDGVDPRRIVRAIIFLDHPQAPGSFTVARLRAEPGSGPSVAMPLQVPFIDRWGQFIPAAWPGKIVRDQDLKDRHRTEASDLLAHPRPAERNQWGGWEAGPQRPATGFFRREKVDGRWWLVDPAGRLFWSQGICCVGQTADTPIDERRSWFADLPEDDPAFADCFATGDNILHGFYHGRPKPRTFDFLKANLKRIYGPTWGADWAGLANRRLQSWGFTTIGNWSGRASCAGVPGAPRTAYTEAVWFWAPPIAGSVGYWGQFKDPFDPLFAKNLAQGLAERKAATGDPWCLGFFVDNEVDFGDTTALARWTLASPATQPAKVALVAWLKQRHPTVAALNAAWGTNHGSWESLGSSTAAPTVSAATSATTAPGLLTDLEAGSAFITDAWYRRCAEAVHAAAPKQLYLGSRCNGWNRHVLAANAKHADVASFNLYRESVADFDPGKELGDVPIIIGEFHWGSRERGLPRGALLETDTEAQRAARFTGYVDGALRHPRIVGAHWFQYTDEPATGRSLDQENYAMGFVDVTDTPYPEMVAAARKLGPKLYRTRAGR